MNYAHRRALGSERETEISRFPALVLIIVPLAAILFQVYVPLFFQPLSFFELPLLVTVYFALMRRSPIAGLLIGAVIGLAQDSLSKNPLGMFGIVKTLVGYLAALVSPVLDVEHPFIRLLLGFFFFLFHQFCYWVLAQALLGQAVSLEVQGTLLAGLLNAIVAMPLFRFLDKLKKRV